jgi:hypothetical protein
MGENMIQENGSFLPKGSYREIGLAQLSGRFLVHVFSESSRTKDGTAINSDPQFRNCC